MKPVFTVVLVALLALSAYKYFQKPVVEKVPEPAGLMVKKPTAQVESAMKVPEGAITYTVDPSTSKIEWSSEKKLIVDWKHNGTVAIKSGELYKVIDPIKGDSVMGKVVIDMDSIVALDNLANAKLIGHLKSPDFFDVATYPTATLEFTAVPDTPTEVTDKTGATYTATGMLTVRGKTNPITFTVTSEETPEGMVTGTTDLVIDRSKFDIKFGSQSFFSLDELKKNLIPDEVPLKITLSAKKVSM
ncbi:MAG: YceI family protein [bacterium]